MHTRARLHRSGVLLAAGYAAILALVAFWPTPIDKPFGSALRRFIAWSQAHGAEAVTYPFIETVANVVLFVPAGFLFLIILGAERWWLTLLAGAAMSATIELGQHYFLSARFSTVNDLFANIAGTMAGAIFGVIWLTAVRYFAVGRAKRRVPAHS